MRRRLVAVLAVLFVLLYFNTCAGAFRGGYAFEAADIYALTNPQLQQVLGAPLHTTRFPLGKVQLEEHTADYRGRVTGTQATARVTLKLREVGPRDWRVIDARVTNGGKVLQLVAEDDATLRHAEQRTKTAYTLFRRGMLREALAELELARSADPRNSQVYYWLSEVQHALGDTAVARANLSIACARRYHVACAKQARPDS